MSKPTTPCRPAATSPNYRQIRSPSKLPPSPASFARATRSELTAAKRLLSGPLLEITVGAERKSWHIHHNLLRHHSKYFDDDNLINGEEKRIRDGKVDLPEEDPSAFRVFVKWLYQGRIDDVSTLKADQKWNYAFACQNLYILCEKIGMHELKNQAIDQFRKGCYETRLVPGGDEIRPIYNRTAANSPFRKLVSRIAARQIMDPDSRRDASMYLECFKAAPNFAVDVLNAIREGTEGVLLDDPTEGNSCRYHEHVNGETCCKTVHFKDGV